MTTPQEGVVHTEQQDIHTPEETTQMLRQILGAIGTMATKDDLAGFATKDDLKNLATKDDLKPFATKEDVRKMIAESEHRVKDYTDKRVSEAEGKIIGIVRREDEKVDETIRTLEINEVVTATESKRLQQLGPFPKLI